MRRMLLAGVLGTLVLYHTPAAWPLAYPLLLISTVAHEMGHGLGAMLVGGHFHMLEMHADGSGMATWSGVRNPVLVAWIAAAGLLGPAVTAAVGFRMARSTSGARSALSAAGVACLVSVLLVVRGLFADVFIGILGLLLLALSSKAGNRACQFAVTFLCVQLSLSCYSRSDYLFTRYAGSGPSDVEVIARQLFLPFWVWGALIAFLSLTILLAGLRPYFRSAR